jgi:hypothetical protein
MSILEASEIILTEEYEEISFQRNVKKNLKHHVCLRT